ncbi:hypothetical protein N8I77_006232 [Diaporthe amygdali]|uniref:lytic cellulose monooxygenase (C4-dehydrogenating) n=1 Tax=Phomopsis amygdali TaxID=1214568 RepID=A0AAD9W3L0_PHOAM|nr:hypothetical protein N8I77_006232 [Diaporthe amygdali]
MYWTTNLLATLLYTTVTVIAHGHVTNIVVNGIYYRNFLPDNDPYNPNPPKVMGWTAGNTDNGYVAPDAFQSPDIICHKSATPGKAHVAVQAGDSISIQWNTWPDSHHGPVVDYLAKCNGPCETVDKNSLKFFKIDGAGLVSGSNPGYWADDALIANGLSWLINIPEDIAPGSYVLRHEIIALHGANQANGAQAYPQCFNLEISGTGTSQPSGVTNFDPWCGELGATEQVDRDGHVQCHDTRPDNAGDYNFQDFNYAPDYGNTRYIGWKYPANLDGSIEPHVHNEDDYDTGDNAGHDTASCGGGPNAVVSFLLLSHNLGQAGQCGGSNYPGPTSCYGSNYCSTINPYYAQCVPGPVGDGDGQTLYGQCGGQGWSGKTSCQAPATCSVFHSYYAQCLY